MTGLSRRSFLLAGAGLATAAALSTRPGLAGFGRSGGASGFSLAWVRPATPGQWAALDGFDLTHKGGSGGVEILLWPGDMARLAATGLAYEITVDDVVERDRRLPVLARPANLAAQPGERADYRNLSDYERDLHGFAKSRPDLARVIALPLNTGNGRRVYGVEIADGVHRPDGRPTFYVDGLHHAREWPSGEMAIMFAHDLVRGFGNDDRITRLLRALRIVVVPVVNVDGFEYSRGFAFDTSNFVSYPIQAIGAGSYWRKNRRDLADDAAPPQTGLSEMADLIAYGVDNNRNYSLGWNGPGTSPLPVALNYPGSTPFSEPETRNVATTVLSRTTTAVLSNHTYSDLVLRPWGDTRDDCPDETLLGPLGAAMAERNDYKNIKGIELYPTTGTMSDWSYGAIGALGYTFEHGTDNFHPPYSGFVPENYAKNREAFFLLAEAAADPAHHCVIRGRTTRGGAGSQEAVRVRRGVTVPTDAASHSDNFEVAITSDSDGRFAVHVGPSTQPKSEKPQAYEVVLGKTVVKVEIARGQRTDVGNIAVS